MVDTSDMRAHDLTTRTISVLVVDDDELVRRGLVDLLALAEDIEVVGSASSAQEALALIPRTSPDVVLLDARLPEGYGITVCRELRSAHPYLRCLLLTSFDDDAAHLATVLAGAAGHLVKQIGGTELLDGIRRLMREETLRDTGTDASLLDRMRLPTYADPRGAALTPDEQEVLELLAGGYTDAGIATLLGLDSEAVRRQVRRLFVKLDPRRRSSTAAIAAVAGVLR